MGNRSPFSSFVSSSQKESVLNAKYTEDTICKFPTFQDNSIEHILNSGTSLSSLLKAIVQCDIILKDFQNSFQVKLIKDIELVKAMTENSFNIEIILLQFVYLSNMIELWYSLFQYKYSPNIRDKKAYGPFINNIKSFLMNKVNPEQYVNFVLPQQYKTVYSSIDETIKNRLITEVSLFQLFIKEIFVKESINHRPSLASTTIAILFLISLLNEVYQSLTKLYKLKTDENLFGFLKDISNIEKCAHCFHMVYSTVENDLFNQSELGEEWRVIKSHYKRIIVAPRETVQDQLQSVYGIARLGYASVSKAFSEWNDGLMRNLGTGIYMIYYFFNKKQTNIQGTKYLMRTKGVISQKIWNFLDVFPVNHMYKLLLPNIAYSKFFYFKRIKQPITYDYIMKLSKQIKDFKPRLKNKADNSLLSHLNTTKSTSSTSNSNSISKHIDCNCYNAKDLLVETIETGTETNNDYVKVKLMHSTYIYDNEYKPGYLNMFIPKRKNRTRESIIVHIHGGGFISMSSSSHQNYTRKWCNALDVPVFSIDYRLSPQNIFPSALDDVYQAYTWLITHGEEYFHIEIDTIILAGDSAGGNLVLTLTYLLIMNNLRLPNALFMFYPALNICLDIISNSYFNAITDEILELNLLKYCSESYQGAFLNPKNPFVSPLFMDENILRLLPPVRLIGGSSDPLRDDSIYFLNKLVKLNKDAEMIELKYFTHAFLSYDITFMMKEAAKANEIIINEINKFIN